MASIKELLSSALDREELWKVYCEKGRLGIADCVGIPYNNAGHLLKGLGFYERRSEYDEAVRRRVSCRNPFQNLSEVGAYLLGYIVGDGSIFNAGVKEYLVIYSNDREHLVNLASFFGIAEVRTRVYKETAPGYLFQVCDYAVIESLKSLGVQQRKSINGGVVSIPEELQVPYIRGVFDSDGCVYRNNGGRSLGVGLYGHPLTMGQIASWGLFPFRVGNQGTIVKMMLYASEAVRGFYNVVYKDASIYMQRKKDRFDEYYEGK